MEKDLDLVQDPGEAGISNAELALWQKQGSSYVSTGFTTQTDANGRYVRYGVGSPGGSDLIGIFAGRFVAAEIKTPQGKESEEQRRFGALVESKGGSYVVLRSVEDARAWIARLRSK